MEVNNMEGGTEEQAEFTADERVMGQESQGGFPEGIPLGWALMEWPLVTEMGRRREGSSTQWEWLKVGVQGHEHV